MVNSPQLDELSFSHFYIGFFEGKEKGRERREKEGGGGC